MVAITPKQSVKVVPIQVTDLGTITRLVFANMTGVDQQFTAMTRHRFARLYNYLSIPFYLLTSGAGFKIERDEQIAAFAYLSLRPRSGYIYNVVVDHPFRRLGLGQTLMRHLEQEIRRQGRHWAVLQVDEGNTPARNLYQMLGYKPYHPHFWHWQHSRWFTQTTVPGAELTHSWGRGRVLYHHFASLERDRGDAWAATLVGDEYPLPRPEQGQEWCCLWHGQEIGYAWADSSPQGNVLVLLLEPRWWGKREPTLTFIQLLLEKIGGQRGVIDLHLGSSEHHTAAATLLTPLGFIIHTQPRILMLKRLVGFA